MRYAVSKQRTMASGLTVALSALAGRGEEESGPSLSLEVCACVSVCKCVCVSVCANRGAYLRKGKKS